MIVIYQRILSILWKTAGLSLTWRKFLYRKLRQYGKVPDYPFLKDFYGLTYKGNLNNSIEANIYFYGAFEKPLLFFLRDVLKTISEETSKPIFMDVGANVGQHSLFVSQLAWRVLAFEPYPKVSTQFKQLIKINQISNIEMYECGLSDESESLSYYAPTGSNEGIGSFDENTQIKGNKCFGKLELQKGDTVVEKTSWTGIKLIKIDVEGFEKKVIKGLRNTIKKERPIIVCEVTYGQELSFNTIQDLLNHLPVRYEILTFSTRKPDGRKNKKRNSLAKRTGYYELTVLKAWRQRGQDNLVCIPSEKSASVPRKSPGNQSQKKA